MKKVKKVKVNGHKRKSFINVKDAKEIMNLGALYKLVNFLSDVEKTLKTDEEMAAIEKILDLAQKEIDKY